MQYFLIPSYWNNQAIAFFVLTADRLHYKIQSLSTTMCLLEAPQKIKRQLVSNDKSDQALTDMNFKERKLKSSVN